VEERLGIEHLSVFGLPPVDFVNLAGDLGCPHIATGLTAIPYNPHGYPLFSLRDDPALRRQMIAVMRDRGVSISLGEGLVVREGVDMGDRGADLAIMAELGVRRVNTVSLDPDPARTVDQIGMLAELAAAAGIETTLEFGPTLAIPDLPSALDAVRQVGRSDCKLTVDTMHLVRSGSGLDDLRALDPAVFGYVQLSDVPLVARTPDYMDEAMFERMAPGTGELPLLGILAALPRDLVVGLEVPLRSEAEAGVGPRERLGRCVDAARALLARLDAEPS
jgi:sugar phosphate isomerase/epimerase